MVWRPRIATLGGGDAWQRPGICLAVAQRYAAAFIDLDTRSALDAIETCRVRQ